MFFKEGNINCHQTISIWISSSFAQCDTLNEKLNLLLQTLNSEAAATAIPPGAIPPEEEVQDNIPAQEDEQEGLDKDVAAEEKQDLEMTEKEVDNKDQEEDRVEQMSGPSTSTRVFKPRDALMSRANSLKKAVRQIIEQTEKGTEVFLEVNVKAYR